MLRKKHALSLAAALPAAVESVVMGVTASKEAAILTSAPPADDDNMQPRHCAGRGHEPDFAKFAERMRTIPAKNAAQIEAGTVTGGLHTAAAVHAQNGEPVQPEPLRQPVHADHIMTNPPTTRPVGRGDFHGRARRGTDALAGERARLREAVETNPQSPGAWAEFGTFLHAGYQTLNSLRALNQVEADDRNANLAFEMAFTLEKDADRKIELRRSLAAVFMKRGELKKAEKVLEEAAGSSTSPSSRKAFRNLIEKIYLRTERGSAMPEFGGYGDAALALKKRAKSDPRDPYVHWKLGAMAFETVKKARHWDDAVSDAVDADDEHFNALVDRQLVYTQACLEHARLGNGEKTIQHYKAAMGCGGAAQEGVVVTRRNGLQPREELMTLLRAMFSNNKTGKKAQKVMNAWSVVDSEDAAQARAQLDPQIAKDDKTTSFADILRIGGPWGAVRNALRGSVRKPAEGPRRSGADTGDRGASKQRPCAGRTTSGREDGFTSRV